jgi:NAD(P)-dependent dehydrogenase (short-subunit alcohol dehydrogenase family)
MSEELTGRVAVITGGGRGLGRGVALEMSRAGARVVVADLFADDQGSAADAVVREIEAIGGEALASRTDVVAPEGGATIVAQAIERFGRVDILCTFAGNAVMKRILDLELSDLESSLDVHLKGTFNCVKAMIPHLLEQGSGRILTVSSRGAFQGPVPAYAAAKAGIMGFTAALALELEGTGVTANCLLPSGVTQLFSNTNPRPLGGMPAPLSNDPDDVAPIVAYLATDEAANINGQFIYASGGDVCIYAAPFQVTWANNILRSPGRWTIRDLAPLVQSAAAARP